METATPTIELLYVYAIGRDDGLNFAVGARFCDAPVNGSFALFTDRASCAVFVNAMREKHACRVEWLPSVPDYPHINGRGETVWACCESSIGPTCPHKAPPVA